MKRNNRSLCFLAVLGALAGGGRGHAETLGYTVPLPTVTLNSQDSWPRGSMYLKLPPVQINTFPQTLRANHVVDGVTVAFNVTCSATLSYINPSWYQQVPVNSPLIGGALLTFASPDYVFPTVLAYAQTGTPTTLQLPGAVVTRQAYAVRSWMVGIPYPNLPFFTTGTNTTFPLVTNVGAAYFGNYLTLRGVANPVTISGSVSVLYYYHHK